MTSPDPALDPIIARLYRMAGEHAPHYRRLALTQLAQIIDFDGALWGTGHLGSEGFHSVDVLGVDEDYPTALAQTRQINPIYGALKSQPGQAISMQQVFDDDGFYQSALYQSFFSRFGVERILGIMLPDENTGIFTLISLYRFERERPFSTQDGKLLTSMAFHMMNGASHAYFLHLRHTQYSQPTPNAPAENFQQAHAICDRHGIFFEVQPRFTALLQQYFPDKNNQCLPFSIDEAQSEQPLAAGQLQAQVEPLSDLYCISIWESRPIDCLSERERDVVNTIVHGLTFKEAAKRLGVAPSTVSNHLYNVYRKLNISSRTELAQLLNPYGEHN